MLYYFSSPEDEPPDELITFRHSSKQDEGIHQT